MIRKLTVLLAMTAALLGAATSAAAQDYSGCVLTLDPTTVTAGADLEVTGSGFQPGFETDLVLDRGLPGEEALGTVTTEADGSFVTVVTIPAGTSAGSHTISAPCSGDPASGLAEAQLTVQAGGGTDGGTDGTTDGGTDGGTDGAPPAGVDATLSLSDNVVQRLEPFTATVTGAQPGSSVQFAQLSVRVVVGQAVADSNGVARLTMAFPANATLGAHEVEAQGTDADGTAFTLRRPITVTAVAAAGGSVPRTGSDVGPLAIAGGGALVVGAAFAVVARRRRQSHALA